MMSLSFSWDDISNLLGVSVTTLQRRAKEWNITRFTATTDAELDDAVRAYLLASPMAGRQCSKVTSFLWVYMSKERG